MTSVFILNRITGKNYDFLKLGHSSYFLGIEICINLVSCLFPIITSDKAINDTKVGP